MIPPMRERVTRPVDGISVPLLKKKDYNEIEAEFSSDSFWMVSGLQLRMEPSG